MVEKIEETVHDKTPVLNNLETYVLTHNRYKTYLVLFFSDLNKAQIYKMPYRDNPHHEIESFVSCNFLNLYNTNENKNFPFEIEDKDNIYVGEKAIKFQTDDKLVKYFSKEGFNDLHFGCGYGDENIYFMLDQKYIQAIEEYKNATQKDEYEYLYTKDGDNKGIVEYGNDFIYCIIIHERD